MEFRLKANDLGALADVAPQILRALQHTVVLVEGEMGAGKTTLISALCRELGVAETELSSPTFSLVNEYLLPNSQAIYHFDCYRIRNEEEAFQAGLEEYLFSGSRCFIEWPDKIRNLLPSEWTELSITLGTDSERIILISNQHV